MGKTLSHSLSSSWRVWNSSTDWPLRLLYSCYSFSVFSHQIISSPSSLSYLWMRTSIAETAAFLQSGEKQCHTRIWEISIVWLRACQCTYTYFTLSQKASLHQTQSNQSKSSIDSNNYSENNRHIYYINGIIMLVTIPGRSCTWKWDVGCAPSTHISCTKGARLCMCLCVCLFVWVRNSKEEKMMRRKRRKRG